ncbi:MAG TPA: 50S ribosomal protein L29 [bacterium]|nr:50S ribosomal protein L29 [bacterium]
MTSVSLRDMTVAEIQKQLQEARQELFTLRLQRASGKLQNPARVPRVRRTAARLLTALREREAAGGRA